MNEDIAEYDEDEEYDDEDEEYEDEDEEEQYDNICVKAELEAILFKAKGEKKTFPFEACYFVQVLNGKSRPVEEVLQKARETLIWDTNFNSRVVYFTSDLQSAAFWDALSNLSSNDVGKRIKQPFKGKMYNFIDTMYVTAKPIKILEVLE